MSRKQSIQAGIDVSTKYSTTNDMANIIDNLRYLLICHMQQSTTKTDNWWRCPELNRSPGLLPLASLRAYPRPSLFMLQAPIPPDMSRQFLRNKNPSLSRCQPLLVTPFKERRDIAFPEDGPGLSQSDDPFDGSRA